MPPTRREFVAGAAAAAALTLPARAATSDTVTPEMFGAKGDGRTNDTRAFAALSAHVNARGGGTVVLRPVTYIVGEQSATGPYAFSPADILHFDGCRGPVVVRGNGATLRCAPGLRYGGFDRSGRALPDARANMQLQNRAVPYTGMIFAENCTGLVDISDVTLDGNLGALQVGGRYDRRGWQAGASGIRMIRNKGPERISRVRSHHHAQDGLLLTAAMDRTGSTTVTDTVCDFNARQGCTISSGSNFVFERCSFRQTGLAPPLYRSLPGAGVDVEAEKASVRNVAFSACDFTDNAGIGLDAVSDVADMTFDSCKFIGSKNWSAWPAKPGMRFNNCLFLGTLRYLYGDPDPSRAPQFHGCTFTDDPALSPTGKVFLGQGRGTWIALAQKAQNARFTQCHFRLVGEGLLPLSDASVIYEDCDMSQRSPAPSAPRGTYLGTNRISGNVRLEGSIIRGTVLLNGRPVVG